MGPCFFVNRNESFGDIILDGPFDKAGAYLDHGLFSSGTRTGMKAVYYNALAIDGNADIYYDGFDLPIVSKDFMEALTEDEQESCEFIACIFSKIKAPVSYFLLNVLNCLDVIDKENSEMRQDEKGIIRSMYSMYINPSGEKKYPHFFRPLGWETQLICSKEVVDKIKKVKHGLAFKACGKRHE